ncbi:hypothetical protein T08_5996 [Trichinella sp. T8]|nr:hypothetical protein T08_5996 [Trichinella sp. T8]
MSHSIPLHILIHGRVPSDYHWTDWNYHARKFIFCYKYLGNTTTHCGDHVALLEQHKRLDNVNKSDSFLNDFV